MSLEGLGDNSLIQIERDQGKRKKKKKVKEEMEVEMKKELHVPQARSKTTKSPQVHFASRLQPVASAYIIPTYL